MPWCPKCKTEYIAGVTVCPDCGTELVEETKDGFILIPDIHFDKEEDAIKFEEFLHYSNIENVQYSFDRKSNSYVISVLEEKVKETIKLYGIFQDGKENEKGNEQKRNNEKATITTASSCAYVNKEEKYLELKSTASTFIFLGIFGIIFLILNITGTFSIINGVVSITVMGLMFIGIIYIGVTSYIKSRITKSEIGSENDLTNNINRWLTENITLAKLNEMNDETVSSEINFLHKLDRIKEMVMNEFGEINDSYLDRLVEEFYNDNFENN